MGSVFILRVPAPAAHPRCLGFPAVKSEGDRSHHLPAVARAHRADVRGRGRLASVASGRASPAAPNDRVRLLCVLADRPGDLGRGPGLVIVRTGDSPETTPPDGRPRNVFGTLDGTPRALIRSRRARVLNAEGTTWSAVRWATPACVGAYRRRERGPRLHPARVRPGPSAANAAPVQSSRGRRVAVADGDRVVSAVRVSARAQVGRGRLFGGIGPDAGVCWDFRGSGLCGCPANP